jgi:hypothetical protein
MADVYKYKRIPFQPSILSVLALELFSGRIVESQTIYDEALKYQITQGGVKSTSTEYRGFTNKGLNMLRDKGLAESPSAGYWRIGNNSVSNKEEIIVEEVIEDVIIDVEPMVEKEEIADFKIGVGKSVVYVYYLPLYRQMAEQRNETFWQCKIGRTDGDPLQRILSQASTALPERPNVAIIIRTNNSVELENAIHNILTLRGRKIDNSPGAEWFLTSLEEVLSIYKFIQQDPSDDK